MNKTAQRIIAVRKKLGLSQQAFADRMNYSRTFISLLERGKETAGKKFFVQLAILEADESPVKNTTQAKAGSLKEPRAELRKSEPDLSEFRVTKVISNVDLKPVKLRMIKVYSFAQAGLMTDFEMLPEEWQDEVEFAGRDENAFGLELSGDSMEPKFSAGDIIICTPSYAATNGDLVAASLKDPRGVVFKQMHVRFRDQGPIVRLSSFNPDFAPMEHPRENFFWLYPVVRVVKKTK